MKTTAFYRKNLQQFLQKRKAKRKERRKKRRKKKRKEGDENKSEEGENKKGDRTTLFELGSTLNHRFMVSTGRGLTRCCLSFG